MDTNMECLVAVGERRAVRERSRDQQFYRIQCLKNEKKTKIMSKKDDGLHIALPVSEQDQQDQQPGSEALQKNRLCNRLCKKKNNNKKNNLKKRNIIKSTDKEA